MRYLVLLLLAFTFSCKERPAAESTVKGDALSFEEACRLIGGSPANGACRCGSTTVLNPWFPLEQDKAACLAASGKKPPEQEKCESLGGSYAGDKCKCGAVELTTLYERCADGEVASQRIISMKKQDLSSVVATEAKHVEGYSYTYAGPLYLATFTQAASVASKQMCYAEASVERLNDDRVLPGGAGPEGGRIACAAINGRCPDIYGCLDYMNTHKDASILLWEMKWIAEKFGEFEQTTAN